MQCIGDECFLPPSVRTSRDKAAGRRLIGTMAFFCLSAWFGAGFAPMPKNASSRHLAAIAPPIVMVSEIPPRTVR